MKFLVLFVVFVCLVQAFYAVDFKFCEPPATPQPYVVTSIELNPNPAKAGTNETITVVGKSSDGTTGGTLVSSISKGGVHLFTFTYNICEISTTPCPIPPNQEITLKIVQPTPSIAFPGEYLAHNVATDENSKKLSCVEFKFDVSR